MKIALRNWVLCALVLALGVLPAWQVRAQPPQQSEYDLAKGVVEKVRSGQTTLEKAFADGLLSRPVLLAIVGDEQALDPGRGFWNPAEETYKWTGFLVAKYPEILNDNVFLDYGVRLRLALYFFRQRDNRGAQIMEKIIDEQSREKPDTNVLMTALYRLSQYYLQTNDNQKAVAVALRVRDFNVTTSSQANILLSAARGAWAAGEKERANEIYQDVIALGYGWATGHAYREMATHLTDEGKREEARALLQKPIDGLNADQIRVVLDMDLAHSYFETGEWDEAKKWAQAAVRQYESLANPIKNHNLEIFYEQAKNYARQVEAAQNNPVDVMTRQIRVTMPADATAPVRTFFSVNAQRALTIRVQSNDPALKVWIFRDAQGRVNSRFQTVGVAVAPEIIHSKLQPEVTVSFDELPDKIFRIPVIVTARPPTALLGEKP
jgi:tetratricopeptide (TPR) repeat protein